MEAIYLPKALDDLERIDKLAARRIIEKILRLSLNVDSMPHIPLKSSFEGFFKLRIGDWRVIYEMDRAAERIIIHKIGYRKDIYNIDPGGPRPLPVDERPSRIVCSCICRPDPI